MTDELKSGPVEGPGYYDLDDETYHADPAPKPSMSSSVLAERIMETPRQAKEIHPRLTPKTAEELQEEEADASTKKFDLGSIAHILLLGKGRPIHQIDAPNYKKKAAQDERKKMKAQGYECCLVSQYEQAEAMIQALRNQLADDPDNHDAFTGGRAEVSALCQFPLAPGKMWARVKLDYQMADRWRLYDYKTFARGADPDAFAKYLAGNARDIQDPLYSRVVAELENCDWEEISFRFVVQDTEPPYLATVIELMDERETEKPQGGRRWSNDRLQWAMDMWAASAASKVWRGYVPRTYSVAAPTWAQSQWELRRQKIESGERMLHEAGVPAVLL